MHTIIVPAENHLPGGSLQNRRDGDIDGFADRSGLVTKLTGCGFEMKLLEWDGRTEVVHLRPGAGQVLDRARELATQTLAERLGSLDTGQTQRLVVLLHLPLGHRAAPASARARERAVLSVPAAVVTTSASARGRRPTAGAPPPRGGAVHPRTAAAARRSLAR